MPYAVGRTRTVKRMHVVELSRDFETIELLDISDLHEGSPAENADLLNRELDYLEATSNAFAIIGGDIFEAATKHSVGDVHNTRNVSVVDSRHVMAARLRRVREKILGVIGGNHDHRVVKESGEDSVDALCCELGLYYADDGELDLKLLVGQDRNAKLSQLAYSIYAVHGWGGGRTMGAKANNLVGLRNLRPNADLYLFHHTHTPMIVPDVCHEYHVREGVIIEREQLFIMGAAYLHRQGYPVRQGYKASRQGAMRAFLNGRWKELWADTRRIT